jgi:AcrR family transcriptional regulator
MTEKKPSLKHRVLAAARELFHAKGYFGVSTREVASKAGTSESGVFRMFANKYELLMAVYNEAWGEVNREIETQLAKTYHDPRQRILEILRVVWTLYEERPLLMSFIIINTGNTDTLLVEKQQAAIITSENIRYIERLELLCKECEHARVLPQGITPRALSEGLLGITEGILLGWYLADKTKDQYPSKVSIKESLALIQALLHYAPQIKVKRHDSSEKSRKLSTR